MPPVALAPELRGSPHIWAAFIVMHRIYILCMCNLVFVVLFNYFKNDIPI